LAEDVCPGSCNYRWREANTAFKEAMAAYDPLDPETSRPQPPEIRPVKGTPWCVRDQSTLRRELAELDELAAMLAAGADGHRGRRPGAKIPRGKQHGGPSPSPTADMLSELYGDLSGWEVASLGQPRTRRGFLAHARTQTIARLCDQFDTVIITLAPASERDGRMVPFAEYFGEGVRHWHKKLIRLAHAGTGTQHKPVRCPRCDQMMLFWTEGEDYVECRNQACGRLIGMDEFDDLAATQAQEQEANTPA
jgi:hypothetical protein